MPIVRKRRAPAADDVSEDEAPTQRRRISPESDDDDIAEDFEDATQGGAGQLNQMAKKLVRLALACEYSRQPIRRADISTKVLGTQGRQFKNVFTEAQMQLRAVFGMEMTELPMKEKVTLAQRRAAQKAERTSTTTNSWVLTTTLPDKYRQPTIIPPAKVPTHSQEAAYTGLYTFMITAILLNGGTIQEAKLDRYLKRTNTDQTTPAGQTDKVLARLCKENYLIRVKDNSSGEEVIEYAVGPRGKVEVGEEGAAGLVRKVYGENAPEDLEQRLERSLGLAQSRERAQAAVVANGAAAGRGRGRPRRQETQEEEQQQQEQQGEDSSDEE
ncbi:uncharacterized protein K452DRAFT_254209 [Aplosporella prunicola CBS 121167]|uniref:MAGE domain-containing protein n=1 Tax=Aplosporella prunicola CBS 121167 TaxID=1176127 RepID=A0A6A6B7W8_9PEZI|nr:uncharacterized protein K452DRAFT_254209 [Aplosporella prunicola CBS 121167]KAF2139658.1 hypothetical protein K452DRAFT_254209 [Aplosporella prunicola CBS 121167]